MQFWMMLGMTLIIFSWLLQLLEVWDKGKNISLWFVFFYSLGVISLIIDGFIIKNTNVAFMNIISLVFSALVLGVVLNNQKDYTKKKEVPKKKLTHKKK